MRGDRNGGSVESGARRSVTHRATDDHPVEAAAGRIGPRQLDGARPRVGAEVGDRFWGGRRDQRVGLGMKCREVVGEQGERVDGSCFESRNGQVSRGRAYTRDLDAGGR